MFITLFVVAYPDNLAAHIVGDDGFGRVAVSEHDQAVVIVGVVIVRHGSRAGDGEDVVIAKGPGQAGAAVMMPDKAAVCS